MTAYIRSVWFIDKLKCGTALNGDNQYLMAQITGAYMGHSIS